MNAFAGASLFTSDGTQYNIKNLSSEVKEIADAIEKDMKAGRGADNIIFYVHGRGKEPKKSLDDVIPHLEEEYSAKVIMFHWFPSYKGPAGYPNEEADAAAPDLLNVLASFQKFKKEHPEKFSKIKSTLLVHSMGNIVFAKMMESYKQQSLEKNLFDTVILNSADADAKGHDQWVKKIDFSDSIYITVNKNDNILGLSAKRQREKRLGQKLETMLGKDIPLANNANYVDFSKIDVNHRYFLKGGQDDNPYLEKFYDAVLNGNPVNLKDFDGAKAKAGNGNQIFVFENE
jgi:esterase/lipase superfamily enzyme